MKLKKIFSTAFFLLGMFFGYSQNVASTANLTSGGLNAGTNGIGNTFYGFKAGNETFGNSNVFVGANITPVSGNNNTHIGFGAGYDSSGNNNTYLGYQAGAETTGSNNIFIGASAGFSNSATNSNSNQLVIDNLETSIPLIWGDFALDQLKFNGKVGIGNGFPNFPMTAGSVNVSNYNLFVKGGILTDEVRVSTTWADYVFEKEYDLKPLSGVEEFIKKNGHLPNVPSAQKVQEDGIELGEMVKIQHEKIEELTLYVIQLNKENQLEKEEKKTILQKLADLEEKVNLLLKK